MQGFRLHTILLLALLVIAGVAAGQQGNTWYFGYGAGANFNPPSPTNILPYAAGTNDMISDEGSAIMCDRNGELLVYCNGREVYNRKRKLMLNGDGLKGHMSSFQSAVIVPLPGSDSIFYVFVTDAIENNLLRGYTYSIVDISRDNGDGEVVTKNVPMQAPGTERLSAVRHANGVDVWIITNDRYSNTFRSWLLTCNGLSPAQVISQTGASFSGFLRINVGVIRVSPDGKKLCHTHFDEGDGIATNEFLQLFDFDNNTGVISNPKTISFFDRRLYGAEFSPDSKLLYITDPIRPNILQLEATLPTAAAIRASAVFVPADYGYFAVQAGPDGRIYAAKYGFKLSAIFKPDVKGAGCDFRVDAFNINGLCNVGLPLFINTAFNDPSNGINIQILDSCTGRVQFNGYSGFAGAIQWNWNFGDGTTSTLQNPLHVYADPRKKYKVQLRTSSALVCGSLLVEKQVIPSGILARPGFRFEARCDSGFVRMVNTSIIDPPGSLGFIWSFGDGATSTDTTPVHQYAAPGLYDVKLLINVQPACLTDSLSQPFNNEQLVLSVSPDTVTIDEGASVMLSATGNANRYRWTPGDFLSDTTRGNPVAAPFETTMYRVSAQTNGGCAGGDSVLVKVNPIKDIFVPGAFTPNNDGRNDFFKPIVSRQTKLEYFKVYNRWGQVLYSAGGAGIAGWDGMHRGLPAETGTYIWQLAAYNKEGVKVVRKGTVVLLR